MLKIEFKRAVFFTKMFRGSVRVFKWWRIVRVLPIHIAYAWRHEHTHAQWESFYKQLYTHTQTFSIVLSEFWLLFRARAKGIMFYDVSTRKSWGFAVSWSLSTRGMLTAFVWSAQAPRERGFSSLSAFAPLWISCWRVSFIVCVACVLVFD